MTRLDRTTQDWQLEAYEMQNKHNRYIRHQRLVDEMEREVSTWGVNMSQPNPRNTK